MARRRVLIEIARRLDSAAAGSDWAGVARVDGELASLLPALAAQGPWTDAERPALAHLRARHEAVREQCSQALADVGQRMAAMRGQKDGWLAYAQAGAWTETETGVC